MMTKKRNCSKMATGLTSTRKPNRKKTKQNCEDPAHSSEGEETPLAMTSSPLGSISCRQQNANNQPIISLFIPKVYTGCAQRDLTTLSSQ